ncbi:GUN4 domain-containing protein [Cylindrospermopsis raciborskii]|uniref:GUN4 domain-containing protein n=1 Tax=Cylindrospermopsis raciborskii TaxID=77022 RepID=UPI002155C3AC|nr:GUN4 domain-containing protein [Cylindrospermopsis raciborskii]
MKILEFKIFDKTTGKVYYSGTLYPPINYTKLETLLKAQMFKEADEETDRVMLAVANRQSEGWLRVEDAEKFPCKELRTIDNLWLKYSQGKFGISVQQEIYKNLVNLVGGFKINYGDPFGDRVGWRKDGSWLDYSDLNFSLSAPTGHLPVPPMRIGGKVSMIGSVLSWEILVDRFFPSSLPSLLSSLLSRHVECNP